MENIRLFLGMDRYDFDRFKSEGRSGVRPTGQGDFRS